MVTTLVDVTFTESEDWTYIAEGGASVVVRYIGEANPSFSGRVLRLRKRPIGLTNPPTTAPDLEQNVLKFQTDVIATLLPPGAAPSLHLALVEQSWLGRLAAYIEPSRPAERRSVACIDVTRPYAILALNLIDDTGVCIEIKVRLRYMPHGHDLISCISRNGDFFQIRRTSPQRPVS
jgi:inositol-pentakisphosphate 2-kinase